MPCQIWEPDQRHNQIKKVLLFHPNKMVQIAWIQLPSREGVRKRQASSGLKTTFRLNLWLQLLTYGTNPKQIAWKLATVLRELYGYRTTTQAAKTCNCSTLQEIPQPPNLDQPGAGYKNTSVSKESSLVRPPGYIAREDKR